MNERRQVNAPVVVCLAVALLLPTLYVAGYYAFSTAHPGPTPDHWCRIFRWQWAAEIYKPAAKVESALTGDTVSTYCMPLPGP